MKIAMILGKFSSGPAPLKISELYTGFGMTGSGSSFFNVVKGLAELGNTVYAFCDCIDPTEKIEKLGGATVRHLAHMHTIDTSFDAVISWGEPEMFLGIPVECLRICAQQYADFNYCNQGFDVLSNYYVSSSKCHRDHITKTQRIRPEKVRILPASTNLEFFETDVKRDPHKIIYCSSPDRGLHHLLYLFPLIRKRVPEATLHIYYSINTWLNNIPNEVNESTCRAQYIKACLYQLGTNGENGVFVHDNIPNTEMAKELCSAAIMAYPCDMIAPLEGFAITVLDACAAGCVPIISNEHALPELWHTSVIIKGKPGDHAQEWEDTIVKYLTEPGTEVTEKCKELAKAYSRQEVSRRWQDFIKNCIFERKGMDGHIHWGNYAGHDYKFVQDGPFCQPIEGMNLRHASWWCYFDEDDVRAKYWRVKEGDVILDIGAAFGSYTIMSLAAGAKHVYAFSPEKELKVFVKSLKENGWEDKCTLFDCGLFSQEGFLEVNTQALSKTRDELESRVYDKPPIIIPVTTLSKVIGDMAPSRLDTIKLDVEGAELEVLKGGEDVICKFKPMLVIENHLFRIPTVEEDIKKYLFGLNLGYKHESFPYPCGRSFSHFWVK